MASASNVEQNAKSEPGTTDPFGPFGPFGPSARRGTALSSSPPVLFSGA